MWGYAQRQSRDGYIYIAIATIDSTTCIHTAVAEDSLNHYYTTLVSQRHRYDN